MDRRCCEVHGAAAYRIGPQAGDDDARPVADNKRNFLNPLASIRARGTNYQAMRAVDQAQRVERNVDR